MIQLKIFFSQLIVLLFFLVNTLKSLECGTVKSLRCHFNSTCQFEQEICNQTFANLLGGVFCTALINSPVDSMIESMGCMYDQETTKKCQNQSQCVMKYTDQKKKFLHCCCDQPRCNLNFNLSNPQLDWSIIQSSNHFDHEIDRSTKWCKESFCWKLILLGVIAIVLFIVLIFVCLTNLSQSNPMKRIFSQWISGKEKEKPNEHLSNGKDPLDLKSVTVPLLSSHSTKQLNFNDLTIDSVVLQSGRFSQISRGTYRNQSVALKIFKENFSNQSIQSVFNHEKEIYLLPMMEHPNLLKFCGYFIGEKIYYLMFEYAEDGSLRDYLRSNLINNENELIEMCQQIADGVKYLHQDFRGETSFNREQTRAPIAHRDLKSDNILRFRSNRLVICDFAMSIQLDESQISIHDLQQVGTPRYMAPEILAGTIGNESNALLFSDVYGLALIFWELLSRCLTIEHNSTYLMPYEEQLIEKNINRNPTIDEMLQIVNMESPFNRPKIPLSWRKCPKISEILRTIEQSWQQIPEGRITSSRIAHQMRSLSPSH